jgi:hypothetical protein
MRDDARDDYVYGWKIGSISRINRKRPDGRGMFTLSLEGPCPSEGVRAKDGFSSSFL